MIREVTGERCTIFIRNVLTNEASREKAVCWAAVASISGELGR